MRYSLLTFVAALVMVVVVSGLTALASHADPVPPKVTPHWVLIWALNDKPDHIDGFSSAASCQRMAEYLMHVNDGDLSMASVTTRCLVVE